MNIEIIIDCLNVNKNDENKFIVLSTLILQLKKIKWLHVLTLINYFQDEDKLKVINLINPLGILDRIDYDDLKNILESFDKIYRVGAFNELSKYFINLKEENLGEIIKVFEGEYESNDILRMMIAKIDTFKDVTLIEIYDHIKNPNQWNELLYLVINKINKISNEFVIKMVKSLKWQDCIITMIKIISKKLVFNEDSIMLINNSIKFTSYKIEVFKHMINSIDKLSSGSLFQILAHKSYDPLSENIDQTKLEIIKLLKPKLCVSNEDIIKIINCVESFENKLEVINLFNPIMSIQMCYHFVHSINSEELKLQFIEKHKFDKIKDDEKRSIFENVKKTLYKQKNI